MGSRDIDWNTIKVSSWRGGSTPWSCQGLRPLTCPCLILSMLTPSQSPNGLPPCLFSLVLLTSHWPYLSHMATSSSKGGFILGSQVLLWSVYHYGRETLILKDNSQTLPLEALLKSLEFWFWNKIDYSFPVTTLCHMVSEFQLTMTANFRRPHLAGRGVCGMPYGCIMQ